MNNKDIYTSSDGSTIRITGKSVKEYKKLRKIKAEDMAGFGYRLAIYNGRLIQKPIYKENTDQFKPVSFAFTEKGREQRINDAYYCRSDRSIFISEKVFDQYWEAIRANIARGSISSSEKRMNLYSEPENILDFRLLNKKGKVALLKDGEIIYSLIPAAAPDKTNELPDPEPVEATIGTDLIKDKDISYPLEEEANEDDSGSEVTRLTLIDPPAESEDIDETALAEAINALNEEGDGLKVVPKDQPRQKKASPTGKTKNVEDPLGDPAQIYFTINDGKKVHDRECMHLRAGLKTGELKIKGHILPPTDCKYCESCKKYLFLRKASDNDPTTFETASKLFRSTSCNSQLENLVLHDKIKIKERREGELMLKKGDDTFIIRHSHNVPTALMHNNYTRNEDGSRVITGGFHEQKHPYIENPTADKLLEYIGWYSYEKWHGESQDPAISNDENTAIRRKKVLKPDPAAKRAAVSRPCLDRLLSIGHKLEIWRIGNNKYGVWYTDMKVKELGDMPPLYGMGDSVEEACEEYINALQGTTLIFDPMKKTREEIKVL